MQGQGQRALGDEVCACHQCGHRRFVMIDVRQGDVHHLQFLLHEHLPILGVPVFRRQPELQAHVLQRLRRLVGDSHNLVQVAQRL